jgi:hypothetical protein
VNVTERVRTVSRIYNNAVLPVLVDPTDPREVMVDWDAGDGRGGFAG